MEIPQSFTPIDTPLPPMLLSMAGVTSKSRFISLYYCGNKAMWSDSRSFATFPFYTVWEPFTEHLAIAIYLFDTDLGSDDTAATHAIVCDRAEQKIYVAAWAEAERLIENQHPPRSLLTEQQFAEIQQRLAQELPSISELRDLGMFEFFLGSKPEHQQHAMELIEWLDSYVDKALIKKYLSAAESGDYRARWVLERFRSRNLNN